MLTSDENRGGSQEPGPAAMTIYRAEPQASTNSQGGTPGRIAKYALHLQALCRGRSDAERLNSRGGHVGFEMEIPVRF